MVRRVFKNILNKWIFRKKKFDKVKIQYVQNASTARYHQMQGKNQGQLKDLFIRFMIISINTFCSQI